MNKFKVLFFFIIITIWPVLVGIFVKRHGSLISFGKLKFHYENQIIVLDESSFVFDSGCSGSIVHHKKNCNIFIGLSPCFDSNFHIYFRPIYKVSSMLLAENIEATNLFCAFDKTKYHNAGIIGMNIIQKANWHVSLKNRNMEIFPLNHCFSVPNSALCLEYKKNSRPQCTMNINGINIDNILIDMGFNGDFDINKRDFKKISRTIGPQFSDKVTSVATHSKQTYETYTYDDLYVQNNVYKNIKITVYNKNIVGLGFLSRFDHLFWDSRHKKVYLWNEEEK